MRRVLFRKWIPAKYQVGTDEFTSTKIEGTGCWGNFVYSGFFHQWGLAANEDESGFSSYTVGIVECADGTVEEVLPSNLKFIDQQ